MTHAIQNSTAGHPDEAGSLDNAIQHNRLLPSARLMAPRLPSVSERASSTAGAIGVANPAPLRTPGPLPVFRLSGQEAAALDKIISRLKPAGVSIEDPEFLKLVAKEVARIPRRLLHFLFSISSNGTDWGYFLITGFSIDDEAIGDTPRHWDAPWSDTPYLREEIFQCLLSSAVGNLFGWRTQENGRVLRHIVPIVKDADEQLGGSSSTRLLWHTEEAFHQGRADFLSLLCYRNNECAETNLASIHDLVLAPEVRAILSQERFYIEPDKSHLPENNASSFWQLNPEKFTKIRARLSQPVKYAVLHGTSDKPQMVVDEAFMFVANDDHEARDALDKFHRSLSAVSVKLTMKPGDLLFIDNLSTAHGRSIYQPHYGPKQRWLRRVNIRNGRRAFSDLAEPDNGRVMM